MVDSRMYHQASRTRSNVSLAGQALNLKKAMALLPYIQQRIMGTSNLSLESDADDEAQNGKNQTPLYVGAVKRNREVARYLASHTGTMDLWDGMDVTPLDENLHGLAPES